jgi:hypothetical protein
MPLTQVQGGMILPSTTLTTPIVSTTMGVGGATPSTSGAGITFPATQSASTNANTLDDYEEGTWTPTLSVGTCGNAGCVYTKIGRFVTVSGFINNCSDRSSASTFQIEGLPFAYANIGNGISFGKTAMYRRMNNATDLSMYMSPTSSAITFYISGTGEYGTIKYSDLNNSSFEMYFSFTYVTS